MSILKVKIKGRRDLTVSANYNSLAQYTQNNDDAKFADVSNPFKDYLFTSSCGNWQDDKIVIKTLPDKGRLFFLTNPLDSVPVYSNCFVGQIIVVRDILDNKVLKFQAEGASDNQFTGTYLTKLKFERVCADTPSNIMTYLSINMVDLQQLESSIFVTDQVKDFNGNSTFKLHVENATFNGFAVSNLVATKNIKNSSANFSGTIISTGQLDLSLTSASVGESIERNLAVNIPIGIYDVTISMTAVETLAGSSYRTDSGISFGASNVYASNSVYANAVIDTTPI